MISARDYSHIRLRLGAHPTSLNCTNVNMALKYDLAEKEQPLQFAPNRKLRHLSSLGRQQITLMFLSFYNQKRKKI